MADRDDPTQYPVDETNDHDDTYYGDVTMTDDQIQSSAESTYASGVDLAQYHDYHNMPDKVDIMGEHPRRFRTNKVKELLVYSKYRQLFPGGGMTVPHACLISGLAIYESSGAATATIRFRDGGDATSPEIMTINLAANESIRDFLSHPIRVTRGIYVEAVSGSFAGTIFTLEQLYV